MSGIFDCRLIKGTRRKVQGTRKKVTAFLITTPVGASSACDKSIALRFFHFRHFRHFSSI